MKRFIRYLYEYEQGKRTRNVGFVKVELDEHECMLHIHGKGLHMEPETKLRLYLFYKEEETCIGIWQGDIEHINPAINYRLHFTKDDVGEPENFVRINGIILSNDLGRKYASVWDDLSVDVDGMREWKEKPQAKLEQPEEIHTEAEVENVEEPEEMQTEALGEPETSEELEEPEQPEVYQAESVKAEVSEEEEPQKVKEQVQRQENRNSWRVTKIQRKELARLPRCEWRLANNNFLLHGYYNYRHLVFIENKQMMYLGVPGIFHEEEEKAASSLGFPIFVPAEELNVTLSPEECDTEEQFGYWCRQVRHPFY